MCIKSEVEEILFNLAANDIVMRPSCWHQKFGPNGLSAPGQGLCTCVKWAAPSEFVTYRLCEQRRFRRACASAQSRQNLRCSLIQAVNQEEPSDRKPDPWPLWMAGHARLKFVMTECSKTQIRLAGLKSWKMCIKSEGRTIFWNMQPVIKVIRPFCLPRVVCSCTVALYTCMKLNKISYLSGTGTKWWE